MIRLYRDYIEDTVTKIRAKVRYSEGYDFDGNDYDTKNSVFIYPAEYNRNLQEILSESHNEEYKKQLRIKWRYSPITDCELIVKVSLFENHILYKKAKQKLIEQENIEWNWLCR